MNTSRGAIITLSNNCKPEADARSEAAEVILRRREQNRLAQKKHRSKARERNESHAQQRAQGRKSDNPSREKCPPPQPEPQPEPSQNSEPPPALPEDHGNGDIFMLENFWAGPDVNLIMDQMSGHEMQTFPDLGATCFCTSIFGPCEFHRSAIRAETEAMSMKILADMSPMQSPPVLTMPDQYSESVRRFPVASPPCGIPRDIRSSIGKENITERFQILLQSVQAAGFKTFDEAVASYYTQDFEPFSEPDLSQKASRGRRLRHVLSEIEESANDWTFWEARGYKEKILEAAEAIYVGEMGRLIEREHKMATHYVREEEESSSVPEFRDLEKLYQHESPNLWGLVTSLAGDQGVSSASAALAALSLLSSSAQDPDLNIANQMNKLAVRCSPPGTGQPARPLPRRFHSSSNHSSSNHSSAHSSTGSF